MGRSAGSSQSSPHTDRPPEYCLWSAHPLDRQTPRRASFVSETRQTCDDVRRPVNRPKNGTASDGWQDSAGNSSAGQFLGRTAFRRFDGTFLRRSAQSRGRTVKTTLAAKVNNGVGLRSRTLQVRVLSATDNGSHRPPCYFASGFFLPSLS